MSISRRRFCLAAVVVMAACAGVEAGSFPPQGGATGSGGTIVTTNVVGGTAHAVAVEQGGASSLAGVGPVASSSVLESNGVSADPQFVALGVALDALGSTPGFFLVRSSTTSGYAGRVIAAADIPTTLNGFAVNGQYNSAQVTCTVTLNWASGNCQAITLANGGQTFTFASPVSGGRYLIRLTQPSSGAAGTVTWPGTVLWAGGSAPTLTATNSKADIATFYYDGTSYYGSASLNY